MSDKSYELLPEYKQWVSRDKFYGNRPTNKNWLARDISYVHRPILTSSDWLLLPYAVHLPEVHALLLARIVDPRIGAFLQVLFKVLRNHIVVPGTVVEQLALLGVRKQPWAVPGAVFVDGERPCRCRCRRCWRSSGRWGVAGVVSVVACQQCLHGVVSVL